MKAPKTKVLSTRVPVDVMNTIDELCKKKGQNRSQFLTTMVGDQKSNNFYSEGGKMKSLQVRTIPKEMQDILTTAGVATVGILSFSLISKALQDAVDEKGKPKFSDGEIAFIGTISALAIAMAGFGVVKSLLSE